MNVVAVHKFAALVALVAASVLTGCVDSSGSRVPGQTFSPSAPEHVQILYQDPQRAYTVVGYVSVDRATISDDAAVYRKFKAVAATMGADAVIIDSLPKTPFVGIPVLGKGRAIRWQ